MIPSSITPCTGWGTGSRVSSLTMRNTDSIGRSFASRSDHPVRLSATGLSSVTFPRSSVTITASPMLRRVSPSRS